MTNLNRRQLLTAGALGAVAIPATAAGTVAAQAGPRHTQGLSVQSGDDGPRARSGRLVPSPARRSG